MTSLTKNTAGRNLSLIIFGGLLAFTLLFGRPASALTDQIVFSVNGDTTLTAMTQGDTISWGANCDVGSTINWEVWFDINNNSLIDLSEDFLVGAFPITDGDTIAGDELPDISSTPDGWCITPPMIMGVAEGQYILGVEDIADGTRAYRIVGSNALVSPPNVVRGTVTIDGYTAPDSLLAQIWVEAEPDNDEFQVWSGATDDSGHYEINFTDVVTGMECIIYPMHIDGYVDPPEQVVTITGAVENVNFNYELPADSIYGFIKDDDDMFITHMIELYCNPFFEGPSDKDIMAFDGRYTVYFGASEEGKWGLGLDEDDLIPDYMSPNYFTFRNDTADGLQHDFVCTRTDTVLYARVTESGELPTRSYMIEARSELYGWTQAVSGTGGDNIVTLHITSLDDSGWNIYVSEWNEDYPVPEGYIIEGTTWGYSPGDTVDINFIDGIMVSDTLVQDPEDDPIDWGTAWVGMFSDSGKYYNGFIDNGGVFTVMVDTGTYRLDAGATGYMIDPPMRMVEVTADTVGGLGFTINRAHCTVTGTLVDAPLPVNIWTQFSSRTGTGNDGYRCMGEIDTLTGDFVLELCDGEWTIYPPEINGMQTPDPQILTIGEIPDTLRNLDFVYQPSVGVDDPRQGGELPTVFELKQNHPNPFNPATEISFSLPEACDVKLEVFNILGQSLTIVFEGDLKAGNHTYKWDGSEFSSGIYLFRLEAEQFVDTKKMILLK